MPKIPTKFMRKLHMKLSRKLMIRRENLRIYLVAVDLNTGSCTSSHNMSNEIRFKILSEQMGDTLKDALENGETLPDNVHQLNGDKSQMH